MKQLLLAFSVVVLAFGTAAALADDASDTKLISEMDGMKPMTPAETAQARAGRDAAKAKWATMTPAEKTAVVQSMQSKRIGDLSHIEKQGENDMLPMSKTATAQEKAAHDAAKAKWAAMTPEEKAAVRESTRQKRLADLSYIEKYDEEDSMARYLTY